MCSFCLAHLGLVVAKTVSAGGLAAALAVKSATSTTQQKRFQTQIKRSNENVNTHSREPESSFPRRMARGSQKAPGQREAAHMPARRHCRRTPPASLGQSRKELCLRFAKRQDNASRPLRRPKPADRVPLHVWPGVAGGLPQLLLQHGSHGRRTCASGATKRLLCRCFPGADFQNRSL